MSESADAVVQLLGSLSSPREVRAYLDAYAAPETPRFVVRVDDGDRGHDEAVDEALAVLERLRVRAVVCRGDEDARDQARALRAHKLVFLTPFGGLNDAEGNPISAINLAEDEAALFAAPWVTGPLRDRLVLIRGLLEELPPQSSVSIVDPAHLARELFTHRGAGTLIRRGEHIARRGGFADVDTPRVAALLERCFGRPLAAAYFEQTSPIAVYLAESYRAVAVVTEHEGVPYLDKLAVTAEAQGIGVAASLWSRLTADHPCLFWRSRESNSINPWYFARASGAVRASPWVVFWLGLEKFDQIARVAEVARALPATLKDHGEEAA